MKYIKGLDTLRAFAVIFVIIEHWWLPIDPPDFPQLVFWVKGLVPDGGFGVNLFFVLSGFLITNILLNAVAKNPDDRWRIIKNFIIRRMLRIFPVYYATIFILLYLEYPDIKNDLAWLLTYTSNILYFKTQSFNHFSHTWSLAVEEQFYLVWPWFIIFMNPKNIRYVLFGSLVIGMISVMYTMWYLNNWGGYLLMPSCMQAFGIGGLYAYMNGKPAEEQFIRILKQAVPAALLAHFYFSFSNDGGVAYNFTFLTVNSIISIWLIHLVIHNKSLWLQKNILENSVLNKIGQISYGIYLFHFVLTPIYDNVAAKYFSYDETFGLFILDWKYNYFLRLLLLFLIALCSYNFFEKPIMNLKKYFNY